MQGSEIYQLWANGFKGGGGDDSEGCLKSGRVSTCVVQSIRHSMVEPEQSCHMAMKTRTLSTDDPNKLRECCTASESSYRPQGLFGYEVYLNIVLIMLCSCQP